jgi:hypothetical protein
MSHPTPAERTLYANLTQLLMVSRNATQDDVEARIEELFRSFLRANPELGVSGLQITMTWRLPDGADDWAAYGTEYRTLPLEEEAAEPLRIVAGGSAEVLAFQAHSSPRPPILAGGSARVIPFPRPSHTHRT